MKTELVRLCADLFDVTTSDLYSWRRVNGVAEARFALYSALHKRGWTKASIGTFMGRDHTTIRHGISKADELSYFRPDYAEKIQEIANYRAEPVAEKVSAEPERVERRKSKYPFRDMAIGDSFTRPLTGEIYEGSDAMVKRLRGSANRYARINGVKFRVTTDRENGVARCERVL